MGREPLRLRRDLIGTVLYWYRPGIGPLLIKSPGPDKLLAEFYQDFEYMLVERFMEMVLETQKQGHFNANIRSGEIALLYKKEDPREVSNYRPNTLLNVDYKILPTC